MAGLPRQTPGGHAVAADKRFRRAHVKPARKRSSSSKHVWLAVRIVHCGHRRLCAYRSVTLIGAASSCRSAR